MAKTYADLLGSVNSGVAALAHDTADRDNFTASYTTELAARCAQIDSDKAALDAAKSAWNAAVTGKGGFYATNTDGTVTTYEPDGSGGVVTRTFAALTAALDDPVTPPSSDGTTTGPIAPPVPIPAPPLTDGTTPPAEVAPVPTPPIAGGTTEPGPFTPAAPDGSVVPPQ